MAQLVLKSGISMNNYPPEIQAFLLRRPNARINDYERYENIYEVDFYENGKSRTTYLRVDKERQMSDTKID